MWTDENTDYSNIPAFARKGFYTPPATSKTRPYSSTRTWMSEKKKNTQSHNLNLPSGDSPYVIAKHVQMIDKNPSKAVHLFWKAINSGDRIDSALKDMATVMKQLDRSDEAIEAIKSFRHLCPADSQESLDNVLVELYKRSGRLEEQIELLQRKLKSLEKDLTFDGKLVKPARSQGKRVRVTVGQEYARLLGNLAWAYMQKNDYRTAEEYYRRGLSFEPDRNKQCNLAVCLMCMNRITEAKLLLQAIQTWTHEGIMDESYAKSFGRASELLAEIESQTALSCEAEKENFCVNTGFLAFTPYQKANDMVRRKGGVLVDRINEGHDTQNHGRNLERGASFEDASTRNSVTYTPLGPAGLPKTPMTQPRREGHASYSGQTTSTPLSRARKLQFEMSTVPELGTRHLNRETNQPGRVNMSMNSPSVRKVFDRAMLDVDQIENLSVKGSSPHRLTASLNDPNVSEASMRNSVGSERTTHANDARGNWQRTYTPTVPPERLPKTPITQPRREGHASYNRQTTYIPPIPARRLQFEKLTDSELPITHSKRNDCETYKQESMNMSLKSTSVGKVSHRRTLDVSHRESWPMKGSSSRNLTASVNDARMSESISGGDGEHNSSSTQFEYGWGSTIYKPKKSWADMVDEEEDERMNDLSGEIVGYPGQVSTNDNEIPNRTPLPCGSLPPLMDADISTLHSSARQSCDQLENQDAGISFNEMYRCIPRLSYRDSKSLYRE